MSLCLKILITLSNYFLGIENNMILCDIDKKLPLYHTEKGKGCSSGLLHKFETESKPL